MRNNVSKHYPLDFVLCLPECCFRRIRPGETDFGVQSQRFYLEFRWWENYWTKRQRGPYRIRIENGKILEFNESMIHWIKPVKSGRVLNSWYRNTDGIDDAL